MQNASPTPFDHAQRIGMTLREDLRKGHFPPGSRLPTMRELTQRFQASLNTVQRAVAELIRDGFLETRGRAGTFVTAHPPHLTRFGLTFMHAPGAVSHYWSTFHQALYQQASAARLSQGRRFVPITNLFFREADNPSYLELQDDLKHRRLTGLILTSPASVLDPRLRSLDPALPMVSIMHSGDPQVPGIVPPCQDWLKRAIHELIARGRRRLALIELHAHEHPPQDQTQLEHFAQLTHQLGVATDPILYQPASTLVPMGVSQMLRLMLALPEDRRPDGLIISDDNLVPHAMHGLLQTHLRTGSAQALDVVAHANFPHHHATPLPVIHLGYDTRWMLAQAMRLIEQMRALPPAERPQMLEVPMPILTLREYEKQPSSLLMNHELPT